MDHPFSWNLLILRNLNMLDSCMIPQQLSAIFKFSISFQIFSHQFPRPPISNFEWFSFHIVANSIRIYSSIVHLANFFSMKCEYLWQFSVSIFRHMIRYSLLIPSISNYLRQFSVFILYRWTRDCSDSFPFSLVTTAVVSE